MKRWVLLAAHVAALWPVGRWYVTRMTDGAGDGWGLAALAAAVAVVVLARPDADRGAPRTGLATALLAASAVAWWTAPPLVAAAFGAASLAGLVSELRFGRRMELALLGLALLALPSLSTLQFFVGWPFRVAVAAVVAPLLRLVGVDAASEGTSIVVGARALDVDAPCSGVWMLWGALLLWLAVAGLRRMPARGTIAGLAAVLPGVFAANVLRTMSLVFVETRPGFPAWMHDAVGMVVLAAACAGVVLLSERIARCAPRCST